MKIKREGNKWRNCEYADDVSIIIIEDSKKKARQVFATITINNLKAKSNLKQS